MKRSNEQSSVRLVRENRCARRMIQRYEDGDFLPVHDAIIQEIGLEVFVDDMLSCTTTCSPWNIREMVIGSLYTRNIIDSLDQIESFLYMEKSNRVFIKLSPGNLRTSDTSVRKEKSAMLSARIISFPGSEPSSVESKMHPDAKISVSQQGFTLHADAVNNLISQLEEESLLFKKTGGVHNAALTDGKSILAWFEDIGRHSALDKLVGWCLLNDVEMSDKAILFSGRVPHEIILKVIRAGCPIIISPGAPTTLSISCAQNEGVTLIGFAKHDRFNVYTHEERIESHDSKGRRWGIV